MIETKLNVFKQISVLSMRVKEMFLALSCHDMLDVFVFQAYIFGFVLA